MQQSKQSSKEDHTSKFNAEKNEIPSFTGIALAGNDLKTAVFVIYIAFLSYHVVVFIWHWQYVLDLFVEN